MSHANHGGGAPCDAARAEGLVIALGVDPTDPSSKGGVCGFAVLDVRARRVKALGSLERGRECEELIEVIERHGIEAVAVEVALELFERTDKPPQARRAINRALLRQNLLSGALTVAAQYGLDAIRPHGRVVQIDSATWRSTLGVKLQKHPITGKPEPYDHAVERAIRFWLPDWPRESTVHERDAAGVCLGAFLLTSRTPGVRSPS